MADEVIKTELLDRHMKEVFDWSDSDILLEMHYGTTLWKRMVEIP
jgi:hypothetical protein